MDGASVSSDEDAPPVPDGLRALQRRALVSELTGLPTHFLGSSARQQAFRRAAQADRRGRRAAIYRPDQRASAISALTIAPILGNCTSHAMLHGSSVPALTSASGGTCSSSFHGRNGMGMDAEGTEASSKAAFTPELQQGHNEGHEQQTQRDCKAFPHEGRSLQGLRPANVPCSSAHGTTQQAQGPMPTLDAPTRRRSVDNVDAVDAGSEVGMARVAGAKAAEQPGDIAQLDRQVAVPGASFTSHVRPPVPRTCLPASQPSGLTNSGFAAAAPKAGPDLTCSDDAWRRLVTAAKSCTAFCRSNLDPNCAAPVEGQASGLRCKLQSKAQSAKAESARMELAASVASMPVHRIAALLAAARRVPCAPGQGGSGSGSGSGSPQSRVAALTAHCGEFGLLPRKGTGLKQPDRDLTWPTRAVALVAVHVVLADASDTHGQSRALSSWTGADVCHVDCALLLADSLLVHCGLPPLPVPELAALARALSELWAFTSKDATGMLVSLPAGAPECIASLHFFVRVVRQCSSAVLDGVDAATRANWRVLAAWRREQREREKVAQQQTAESAPQQQLLPPLEVHVGAGQMEQLASMLARRHAFAVYEAAKRGKEGPPKKLTQRFRSAYPAHLVTAQPEKGGHEDVAAGGTAKAAPPSLSPQEQQPCEGAEESHGPLDRLGSCVLKRLPQLVAWDAAAEAGLAEAAAHEYGSAGRYVLGLGLARATGYIAYGYDSGCGEAGEEDSKARGDAGTREGDDGVVGSAAATEGGSGAASEGSRSGSGVAAQVMEVCRAVLEAALDGVHVDLAVLGDVALQQLMSHVANVGWLRQASLPHPAAAAAAAASAAPSSGPAAASAAAIAALSCSDGPILLQFKPLHLPRLKIPASLLPVSGGTAREGAQESDGGSRRSSMSLPGEGAGGSTLVEASERAAVDAECMAEVAATLVPVSAAVAQKIRQLRRYALEARQRRRAAVHARRAASSPSDFMIEAPISGCWQTIAADSLHECERTRPAEEVRKNRAPEGKGSADEVCRAVGFQQHLALLRSCLRAYGCVQLACKGRAALRAAVQLIVQAHEDALQLSDNEDAAAASGAASGGLVVLPFVTCGSSSRLHVQEARDRILGAMRGEAEALSEAWQAWRRLALNREACRLLGMVQGDEKGGGDGEGGGERPVWRPYGNGEYGTEAVTTLLVLRQRALE